MRVVIIPKVQDCAGSRNSRSVGLCGYALFSSCGNVRVHEQGFINDVGTTSVSSDGLLSVVGGVARGGGVPRELRCN